MNRNRLAILPGLTHYTMISPQLTEPRSLSSTRLEMP